MVTELDQDNDNLHKAIIKWALNELLSLGYVLNNNTPEEVQQTPWSYVIRFETKDGYIYLKHTPELFALEPIVIKMLHEKFHASVPSVIAHNPKLYCFLMKDAGKPLREILNQQFDEALICRAVEQFTLLQIAVSDHVTAFLDIGIPDYRLDKLPTLFKELIAQKNLLQAEGLSKIEIDAFESMHPKIVSLCNILSKYPVKQTIVQPDFNDNNTLVDEVSHEITVIDLGEIVISHPFFSLFNFLRQVKKYHGLTDQDTIYNRIKETCFKNYKVAFGTEAQFIEAIAIAKFLNIVYALSDHYRFMLACGKDKLVSAQHWKLGNLLKELKVAFQTLPEL